MQQNGAISPTDSESFSQALETLRIFCGMVLLEFARNAGGLRDRIIKGFIARGMTCTDSIFTIWQHGSDEDAWILHRSLLDRLFHLHYIVLENNFTAFEEYTFVKNFEARRKLLSEKEMLNKFSKKQSNDLKELLKLQEPRYLEMKNHQPRWHRPNAEKVARSMGLGFLYRYGYDYASRYVHPMADEGEPDFSRLISKSDSDSLPDPTVIRNSLLAQSMLIQEGLNASTMKWRAIVYNYLDQFRTFLVDKNNLEFGNTLYKIGKNWPGFTLCKPSDDATLT